MTMEKTRCSSQVYGGWSSLKCSRNAVAVEEGKPYCRQHLPSEVLRRNEAWKRKFEERRRVDAEHFRRQRAIARLTDGVPTEVLERLDPGLLKNLEVK